MVDVGFISDDVADKESAGFRNFFDQIELLATSWKAGENQEKRIFTTIGDLSPGGSDGNVFRV